MVNTIGGPKDTVGVIVRLLLKLVARIMTTNQKIDLLNQFNDAKKLSNNDFLILKKFSKDYNVEIRSIIPPILVKFVSDESKDILLTLARDIDPLVRTEAYDSLSVFLYYSVEIFLFQAIYNEPDELARSYAILSWADVVLGLKHVTAENIFYLQNRRDLDKSDDCKLSYCYGLYLFGQKNMLTEILCFLNKEDYHLRCAALNLLSELVNQENKELIRDAVMNLLTTENAVAVKDRAIRFLQDI